MHFCTIRVVPAQFYAPSGDHTVRQTLDTEMQRLEHITGHMYFNDAH